MKLVMHTKNGIDKLTEVPYQTSFVDGDQTFGPHIMLMGAHLRHRCMFTPDELQMMADWLFTQGYVAGVFDDR